MTIALIIIVLLFMGLVSDGGKIKELKRKISDLEDKVQEFEAESEDDTNEDDF